MLFRISENPIIAAYPELQQQLTEQTTSIYQSIERELKRARIAGNQKTNITFNPYQELTALSQLLKNVYSEKQLQIKITAPDLLIHYDREDLLELIGNLLDNACKWAVHTISITIAFSNKLVITIEDDGPGINNQNAQLLTQRGLRLDETVDGHGLGLAIVRDITEFYGGSLNFDKSIKLGGFLVKVYLPLK
jgi:signal transduction histidine kinase